MVKRLCALALFVALLVGQLAVASPHWALAQPDLGSPASDAPTSTVASEPSDLPLETTEDIEAAAEPAIGDQVRIIASVLNVREDPDTTAQVISQLMLGAVHTVLDGPVASGGYDWYLLDLPGDADGWVAGLWIEGIDGGAATSTPRITPAATETSSVPSGAPQIGDIVVIDVSALNVRTGPGTNYSIITTVTSGSTYSVIDGPRSGSGMVWVRLDLPGATDGWVASQYVRITTRQTPTNTSTPSLTPTSTVTTSPTLTPTSTVTSAPTFTPTSTPTLTGSETATPTATYTPTLTSTPASTPTKAAGTYNVGDIVAVQSSLNVRTGPGTTYGVTTVVSSGTQGTVRTGNTTGGTYTWIEVQFPGVRGWVAANYVTHLSMATATPPASTSQISIALNCTTNPERITITNGNRSSIVVISIGTLYQPGSNEPFVLNQTLGAGLSRTYLSGSLATGTFRLSTTAILTDSAGASEGVRVVTSAGTVTRNCPAASSTDRWVEVDLSSQYMRVYQGTTLIAGTYVSTGRYGFDTPIGTYRTWLKYTSQTMTGCIQGECYVVPNVPWVQYFTYEGHALHGAYWHNNFGARMSHGCVNLPVPFSEWLYYWLPMGSRVVVKQ
ncbi:MAG: SH3 domain-containing protein [Thermomicrobiales bacterium]